MRSDYRYKLPRFVAIFGAIVALLLLLSNLTALPIVAEEEDWDLPDGGHFFTQAGGSPGRGYAITDEDGVLFWSEFKRLGGVPAVGYPISHRFEWNGFTSQVMQRAVFQWHPETKKVSFVNVFDLAHQADKDEWLDAVRQTPKQLSTDADAGLSWEAVAEKRLAILDDNLAIKKQYYSVVGDPIEMNGLPMSPITDMGNNYALRCQRIVIQQWKKDVPWAKAGQVTVALGGSIAKEAGLLPLEAMVAPTNPPLPGITTQSGNVVMTDGVGQASILCSGTINANSVAKTEEILVDSPGPLEITLTVQPHTPGTFYPLDFDTLLVGPDGTSLPTPISAVRKQTLGLVSYRVPQASQGIWKLTVRAKDIGSSGMDYDFQAIVPSNHSLLLSADKLVYHRGEMINLLAIFRDDAANAAITDGSLTANIAIGENESYSVNLDHSGHGVYRGYYRWNDDNPSGSSGTPLKAEISLTASGHDEARVLIKRNAFLSVNLVTK